MSADNWAICPRCHRRHFEKLRAGAERVKAAYGQVPVEDWDQMRTQQEEAEATPLQATFREDYEFYGAEKGEVISSYSGRCTACGLSLHFTDHHLIDGVNE